MKRWLLACALAAVSSAADITEEKLRQARTDQSTWLMYGKDYSGWRYVDLRQINTTNVSRLAAAWQFQSGVAGKFESAPLIFDRMMFLTAPSNHAYALDLLTGRPIWHYSKPLPPGVSICCGQVNRGFAALGNVLYKVNLESTLVAMDAKTGNVLWETKIDDIKKGYSATVAPLIAKNKVVVGVAGAEYGVRGFIDAFDADTGKHAWRFWTVPSPDEPGGHTWGGDSWQRGGASIWITGTYDPELNLTYWGTGNPGPDWNGDVRPGDNLYSDSVVALDMDTGKLKWHFQFTPHDVHDWDAISDPVLLDLNVKGQKIKALIQANRNGYFYVLDRVSGKYLFSKPYTKISWADGIDPNGRPILIPGQDPTEDGNRSCPAVGGGHNWQATSYSPQTGWYYFTATEGCQTYYKNQQDFREGLLYTGSTGSPIPLEPTTGAIYAVDPSNGDIKWKHELLNPPPSGVLATAGGVLFGGTREGYVIALDARTGKVLWKFNAGGPVFSPPISYMLDGKQYVAVSAGASMLTFALPGPVVAATPAVAKPAGAK
jgi:alcohol dehydrogenase (cytochrome c)